VKQGASSLVLEGGDNVVDFKDHLNHLSCQFQLLLLGHDGLEDSLFAHVGGALVVGIDSNEWVLKVDLLFSELANVLNRVISGVLGKSERDLLEGLSEGANGVLLNTSDLVSLLGDSDGAGELSSTATTDDVAVLDHVTDDADGVMEATLGFITDGSGATTDHNSYGLGVCAILNQDDLVSGCAVADLLDAAGGTELLWGDLFETGDNSGASGDGEELNLNTTDPTDGGDTVLHEQMVGLVIETPLAENDIGSGVLDSGDHVCEVVLLHLEKLLIICGALDLKTVLGLWLGGLEWAGEDAHLGVSVDLLHLGVRELFV